MSTDNFFVSAIKDCFYTDGVFFNPMKAPRNAKIAAVALIAIAGAVGFICAMSAGVPFVASVLIGLGIAAVAALIAFIVLKKLTPSASLPGDKNMPISQAEAEEDPPAPAVVASIAKVDEAAIPKAPEVRKPEPIVLSTQGGKIVAPHTRIPFDDVNALQQAVGLTFEYSADVPDDDALFAAINDDE
jgi:hypothetical protein